MTKQMILRRRNRQEAVMLYDLADAAAIEAHKWFLNGGHKGRVLYAVASIEGRMVRAHRLLLGFPSDVVDHINGNGLDNRRENLRIVTHADNIRAAYALHGNWAKSNKQHGITFHPKVLKSGAQVTYAYDRETKRRLSAPEVAARLAKSEECPAERRLK